MAGNVRVVNLSDAQFRDGPAEACIWDPSARFPWAGRDNAWFCSRKKIMSCSWYRRHWTLFGKKKMPASILRSSNFCSFYLVENKSPVTNWDQHIYLPFILMGKAWRKFRTRLFFRHVFTLHAIFSFQQKHLEGCGVQYLLIQAIQRKIWFGNYPWDNQEPLPAITRNESCSINF